MSEPKAENERWLKLARAACDDARLDPGSIEVLRTWEHTQNSVFRLGDDRYLKLYRHSAARQYAIECEALRILEGGAISAPRLIAAAERSELEPYVILTAIPGLATEHAWERLTRSEQLAASRALGAATGAFHRLGHGDLPAVERQVGGLRETVQLERARRLSELEEEPTLSGKRRTLYGLFPKNRDDLLRFIELESNDYFSGPSGLGHCDLSNGHFYVSQSAGAWRFSGIIDWAEAMLVPPEWDLAFMWFWAFNCDGEAMIECLRGYYAEAPRPERLARRCFAGILHGYSWPALWDLRRLEFARRESRSDRLDRQMIEFLFPAEVFGAAE